jgi:arsenite methyltransferase
MTWINDASGTDLVDRAQLMEKIGDKYRKVATDPSSGYHFHTGRRAAEQVGYQEWMFEELPAEALEAFAGVASPFHWGLPNPGETVVDIGSGGGFDAMIAARAVGPDGAVIGVDPTPEMLERSSRAADRAGLDNLVLRSGNAEAVPMPDESVDLVISNGVINLVPDKLGAYREISRILRPGGRIQVADIVVDKPLPEGVRRDIDRWTG